METNASLARAIEEEDAGRRWRAREILREQVRRVDDARLYRVYGELLIRLGRLRDAGEFLFWAESEDEEHLGAVAAYRRSMRRVDRSQWWRFAPAPIRAQGSDSERIRRVLARGPTPVRDPPARRWLSMIGGLATAALFWACTLIGFVRLLQWIGVP